MRRHVGTAIAIAAAAVTIAPPDTAFADAAGPTDFRTEIVSVTPAEPDIALSIEGGDAFVRVVVDPGTEVEVLGYDNEPYLMIDGDGVVWENRRSYATYYNSSRYGTDAIPETVDNDAAPDWHRIGDGGAWAWHDHRAHWMGTEPPLGMLPGDPLPTDVIALRVDGTPVEVAVVSTLVAGPSWWPTVAGAVAAVLLTLLAVVLGHEALAALACGLAALAVGLAQYLSQPAETGPRPIWWLPPAIAVVCAVGAVLWRRSPVLRDGLVVLAGAQIALWAFVRRATFIRPVLPTDAPYWLDRAASAAAVTGALLVIGAGAAALGQLLRPPAGAHTA